MKNIKTLIAIAFVAVSIVACKNAPAEETTTAPMETAPAAEAAPVVDSTAAMPAAEGAAPAAEGAAPAAK